MAYSAPDRSRLPSTLCNFVVETQEALVANIAVTFALMQTDSNAGNNPFCALLMLSLLPCSVTGQHLLKP